MGVASPVELAIHRTNTQRFIDADPVEIALIPRIESWVGGTKKMVDGTPRPLRKYKLIYPIPTIQIVGQSKSVLSSDFVIVGAWDAVIQVGDHWKEGNVEYEVEYMFPNNHYEIKAGGTVYGAYPDHG